MASFFRQIEESRQCLVALLIATALAACGDDGKPSTTDPATNATPTQTNTTTQEEPARERLKDARPLTPPPCPPDLSNCEEASGSILYVERVDPDGDGDAHFVLLSDESISAPGISIIDVRRDLRPHPLPGPGEPLAAMGPVFPGSQDQLQIQAEAVRTQAP